MYLQLADKKGSNNQTLLQNGATLNLIFLYLADASVPARFRRGMNGQHSTQILGRL